MWEAQWWMWDVWVSPEVKERRETDRKQMRAVSRRVCCTVLLRQKEQQLKDGKLYSSGVNVFISPLHTSYSFLRSFLSSAVKDLLLKANGRCA
jgi:hypothetical protein